MWTDPPAAPHVDPPRGERLWFCGGGTWYRITPAYIKSQHLFILDFKSIAQLRSGWYPSSLLVLFKRSCWDFSRSEITSLFCIPPHYPFFVNQIFSIFVIVFCFCMWLFVLWKKQKYSFNFALPCSSPWKFSCNQKFN